MRILRCLIAISAAALPAAIPVSAQAPDPETRLTIEKWLDWERVGSPRISPDGSRVVYTRSRVDRMHDSWESAIWMVNSDGSKNHFLVDGSDPHWSPDGSRLAYRAEDGNGNTQVFVRWMDGTGATSQVTHVLESPGDIAWSPDGSRLAFTMRMPPEQPTETGWEIDLPKPDGAEWTPAPRIIERLIYRHDGAGFVDEGYDQIFVVPADGGTPRQVSRGDWPHGDPVWSADGRSILFDGLRSTEAEYQWEESEIYRIALETGEVRQLTTRNGPDGDPVPSPDGRHIAYVGHDTTSLDYIEDILYVMEADGSNPRALTADLDRSPGGMIWAPDGSGVYFNLEADGYENLYFASLDGEVRPVTEGTHLLSLSDVSAGGRAVGTLQSAQRPEDIVVFSLDDPEPRRITHVNDDVLAGIELGEVEEVRYASFDGWEIHGWIVKPPAFDPSRDYPLILSIHGGPHSMYDGGFSFGWQNDAANGYVVLYTNPRGSSGYGTEFGNAIQYAYPGDDYLDLMAGVDAVIERGYIDTDNMFVTGCSGGGVLSSWVVGHTDRFAAAGVRCPVTNWLSFPGQVDGNYLRWYADFREFPWVDPSEHLRRSPLMYVGNVTTPTLLMTGVLDMRTPISQSEQFYQALKAQGKPAAMIRMNGEWHGTSSKPSNFMRTQLYLRRWFERWGSHDRVVAAGGADGS